MALVDWAAWPKPAKSHFVSRAKTPLRVPDCSTPSLYSSPVARPEGRPPGRARAQTRSGASGLPELRNRICALADCAGQLSSRVKGAGAQEGHAAVKSHELVSIMERQLRADAASIEKVAAAASILDAPRPRSTTPSSEHGLRPGSRAGAWAEHRKGAQPCRLRFSGRTATREQRREGAQSRMSSPSTDDGQHGNDLQSLVSMPRPSEPAELSLQLQDCLCRPSSRSERPSSRSERSARSSSSSPHRFGTASSAAAVHRDAVQSPSCSPRFRVRSVTPMGSPACQAMKAGDDSPGEPDDGQRHAEGVGESEGTSSRRRDSAQELRKRMFGPMPHRQGLSAGQLEAFFSEHCGSVVHDVGRPGEPTCMLGKLAEDCATHNLLHPQEEQLVPDMYAVVDLYIRPATQEAGSSYVHKVNPGGLPVDFFSSHHWGQDFGDYAQSIFRHAADCLPSIKRDTWRKVVYWCCAFAINFHDSFGFCSEALDKAMADVLSQPRAHGMVLSLNSTASAIHRAWCMYELYLTRKLDKRLELISAQGRFNDLAMDNKVNDALLVHVCRQLEDLDMVAAQASEASDKRDIIDCVRARERHFSMPSLNASVKLALAEQVAPALARMGETELLQRALDLHIDVNGTDRCGMRLLTLATAFNRLDTVELLMARGADIKAALAVHEIVAMWSGDRSRREKALDVASAFDKQAFAVHAEAVPLAKQRHQALCAAEYASALEEFDNRPRRPEEAEGRLEAVRGLGKQGSDATPYAGRLVPFIGDSDARVRAAAVDAFSKFDHLAFGGEQGDEGILQKGMLQEDHLRRVPGEKSTNIVGLAACEKSGNALRAIVECVSWPKAVSPALTECDTRQSIAHLCLLNGHMDCLRALFNYGQIYPRMLLSPDYLGRTTLHLAAAKGKSKDMVKLVELSGTGPGEVCEYRDAKGRTVMHVAAACGQLEVMYTLVGDCGVTHRELMYVDGDGRNVAHLAAAHGHGDCLRILLALGVDSSAFAAYDKWSYTPAHTAARNNQMQALRVLIEMHAPVHMTMGPVMIGLGTVALVRHDELPNNPWQIGRVRTLPDNFDMVKFHFERSSSNNELRPHSVHDVIFAPTPLVLAERSHNAKCVEALKSPWRPILQRLRLRLKEDVERFWFEARDGCLPLGYLAANQHCEVLEDLAEKRDLRFADFRMTDSRGRSALHRAAESGSAKMLKLVADLGVFAEACTRALDASGRNFLHHAAESGSAECVACALELCKYSQQLMAGCDEWHFTPAHCAAAADAADVTRLLADSKAPLQMRMGPTEFAQGTVALVRPRGETRGRIHWQLARIRNVQGVGNEFSVVEYMNGARERNVSFDRMMLAPTPRDLATAFRCVRVCAVMLELFGATDNTAFYRAKLRSHHLGPRSYSRSNSVRSVSSAGVGGRQRSVEMQELEELEEELQGRTRMSGPCSPRERPPSSTPPI